MAEKGPSKGQKSKFRKTKNCVFFSCPKEYYVKKNQVPGSKTVIGSLKQKIHQCFIRKKSKNAYKKRKNENFEKQKNAFFSHVPSIILPKNQVPRPKDVLCSPITDTQTHRQTDRHTDRQTTRYFSTRTIPIHSVNEND